jgi:hypothetical protein
MCSRLARVVAGGAFLVGLGGCGPGGPVNLSPPAAERGDRTAEGARRDARAAGSADAAAEAPFSPAPAPIPAGPPEAGSPPPADAAVPPESEPLPIPTVTPLPDAAPAVPPTPPAPPPDAAVAPPPVDAAPDRPQVPLPLLPPLQGCPPLPAADERIADFEDGSIVSAAVGPRGGTRWSVVSDGDGAVATVVAINIEPRCGSQRALRFSGVSTPDRSPIARLLLMPGIQFFDASAFRGITFSVRAAAAAQIRVKVSDRATASPGKLCVQCSDHFAGTLEVGTGFRSWFVPFSSLRQTGAGDPRPSLSTTALYGIEFSSVRNTAFEIVIDDLNFLR